MLIITRNNLSENVNLLFYVQTSNGDADGCNSATQTECNNSNSTSQCMCLLSSLVQSMAKIAANLQNCNDIVKKCGDLDNGRQYYIKSSEGRFAVLDEYKQLAFMKQIESVGATRFTAIKKDCNVYGLCVDDKCMSRCEECRTDTGDIQSVKFHRNNSDSDFSQWMLIGTGAGGSYNLKTVEHGAYMTYKRTPNNDYQLTLSRVLSNESEFQFVQVSKRDD